MATKLPEAPMNEWPLWRCYVTYDGYVQAGNEFQPTPRDPKAERPYIRAKWDEVVFVGAVCEADARHTITQLASFAGYAPVIHSIVNVPHDWVEGTSPIPSVTATHYTCTAKTCYNGHDVDNCWGREDEVCLGSGDMGRALQGVCDFCYRYFPEFETNGGTIPVHYRPAIEDAGESVPQKGE